MYINLLFFVQSAAFVNTPSALKVVGLFCTPIFLLIALVWRWQCGVSIFTSLVAGNDNDFMYDEDIHHWYTNTYVFVFVVCSTRNRELYQL